MGVAVDDAHHLRHLTRARLSHPGRGWVEVFADATDEETICHALAEGLLYASTGPALSRIAVTDDTYSVWPANPEAEVQFIGVGGRLLATKKTRPKETMASYAIAGTERYVRARIKDAHGGTAWTPAVRVVGNSERPTAADRTETQPPPG
jgi:hypothetical protein